MADTTWLTRLKPPSVPGVPSRFTMHRRQGPLAAGTKPDTSTTTSAPGAPPPSVRVVGSTAPAIPRATPSCTPPSAAASSRTCTFCWAASSIPVCVAISSARQDPLTRSRISVTSRVELP